VVTLAREGIAGPVLFFTETSRLGFVKRSSRLQILCKTAFGKPLAAGNVAKTTNNTVHLPHHPAVSCGSKTIGLVFLFFRHDTQLIYIYTTRQALPACIFAFLPFLLPIFYIIL
jgi:hypothetical protein